MNDIGGEGIALWDEEDGFFYDVLQLPARRDDAPQGPLHGRADPAAGGRDARAGAARGAARVRAPPRLVPRPTGRSWPASSSRWYEPGVRRAPPAGAGARPPHEAAAAPHARPGRVPQPVRHPLAQPPPRGRALRLARRRRALHGRLRAGRVAHRPVRRQLQLARPDLVPAQLPAHRGAARSSHRYYGDDFLVEHPTGSGVNLPLDQHRRRPRRPPRSPSSAAAPTAAVPSSATRSLLQTDPHWRDNLLFYEYFHGDTGAGLGASHQTGWTALVAPLLESGVGSRESGVSER